MKERADTMGNYNKSLTATVYIINEGRVLLHMHKKYNTWFPVGGHLEADELPHEAAIREAKEESGLDITLFTPGTDTFSIGLVTRVPTPLCVYHEGDKKNGGEDFLDFIYAATAENTFVSVSQEESGIFRWFTKKELLSENESIKIHIRNTALKCLYCVTAEASEEYYPETEAAFL